MTKEQFNAVLDQTQMFFFGSSHFGENYQRQSCIEYNLHKKSGAHTLYMFRGQILRKHTYRKYRPSPFVFSLDSLSARSLRGKSGRVSLGDVTAHGRVQDWPNLYKGRVIRLRRITCLRRVIRLLI